MRNNTATNSVLKGALILSVGGFITKIIGAFYRIPLTNFLGAEGIGVYQMVFPLYTLLLTVSSTGVPNGVSKLIAEGYNAESVLKKTLKLFIPLGLICMLLMALFSKNLAVLEGNILAKNAYLCIAPSVLLVSVISAFRGYFQGFSNMKPTAISQILEQAVKAFLGLTLCVIFRKNVRILPMLATLAVSVSELSAVIYFLIVKIKFKPNTATGTKTITFVKVIQIVFPIALSTLVLPLTRTVESFFIVNILNKNFLDATSRYGLYSGAVESLVGVPVSLCYAVAVSSVPIVSKKFANGENFSSSVKQSLKITLIFSVLFSLCFFFLGEYAVRILYPKLSDFNKDLTVKMVKLASLSVLFLPLMQTTASILISINKIYLPFLSSSVSAILKIILSVILLNVIKINIFGVIITDILCYTVATIINLVYIIRSGGFEKTEKGIKGNGRIYGKFEFDRFRRTRRGLNG